MIILIKIPGEREKEAIYNISLLNQKLPTIWTERALEQSRQLAVVCRYETLGL